MPRSVPIPIRVDGLGPKQRCFLTSLLTSLHGPGNPANRDLIASLLIYAAAFQVIP